MKAVRLFGLGGVGLLAMSGSLHAGMVITEGSGAFTYTYHAGTDVADPNAFASGTQYDIENAASGNAAYYATSSAGSTGTLSYEFAAAAGDAFSGSATSVEQSLVAFNPGGSVVENIYLNGSATASSSKTLLSSSDNGFYTDYTPYTFSVNGATSFKIEFVLANPSGNAIFTQILREQNGGTDHPFQVTGTVVPEPASLGLAGLSAMGLLARRRR